MKRRTCLLVLLVMFCSPCSNSTSHAQDEPSHDTLLQAAKEGDLPNVRVALDAGADVNATTKYGATALSYASDRGHADIVRLMIERGADVNAKDSFYSATPLDWALGNGHVEIVSLLLRGGADGAVSALQTAISRDQQELAKAILATGKVESDELTKAMQLADSLERDDLVQAFQEAGVELPSEPEFTVDPDELVRYAGTFQTESGFRVTFAVEDDQLKSIIGNNPGVALAAIEQHTFRFAASTIRFELDGDTVKQVTWTSSGNDTILKPATKEPAKTVEENEATEFPPSSEAAKAADLAISSPHWPRFRGGSGRGVADGQSPPTCWDGPENENVVWSTKIAGLSNSSPVVFGDQLFLTSAISEQDDAGLKAGLYGDVASVDDSSEHTFDVFCLNKQSGEILWQRTAKVAVPQGKRHAKSTHANCTPATDGRFVVAFFGSEGLYCYTCDDGQLVWSKDLGLLDSGWFYDRGYQWGFGSSPIIFENMVIVQCDIQDQSFCAAFDLESGSEIWRQDRDTIPSWSTPTNVNTPDGPIVVTNATEAAIAYDARTGEERWRLGPNSEIVVPTPFTAHGLIFLASGYRPIQPIYAVRQTAEGDLTLPEDESSSDAIQWSASRAGPYMPSPLCYGDYLYVCSNSGILTCYQATTGQRVYRKRLATSTSSSFTGSPVAADGHLFLPSESGEVFVLAAGPEFELVSTNPAGESVLTTPAISEGIFFLRTEHQVMALGQR